MSSVGDLSKRNVTNDRVTKLFNLILAYNGTSH